MNKKTVTILISILAICMIAWITGCEKKADAVAPEEVKACPADCSKPCCAAKTAAAAVEGAIVQENCPVMGKPINKDIFAEYKGQKVYFCCPGCIDAFNKEPEKYVSSLPQFKQ